MFGNGAALTIVLRETFEFWCEPKDKADGYEIGIGKILYRRPQR